MTVGELTAIFNIQTDRRSFRAVEGALGSIRRAVTGLAVYFGARHLGKSLIGFNASVDDAKTQIAGMLALAKQTDLSTELKTANDLYDGLRKKAAELPGTTKDYINMLGMLVQPLAQAGVSAERMQDITVNSMVAARGLGEGWQKAARDVSEFVNFGKMNKVDTFLRRVLEPHLAGGGNDADKAKLKAMTKAQRAALWERHIGAKQIHQLGLAQAESFSGRVDKLTDNVQQFLGKVGRPLYDALGVSIKKANDWLGKNSVAVEKVAKSMGEGLVYAFGKVKDAIAWLIANKDSVKVAFEIVGVALVAIALRAAAAWLLLTGPLVLLSAFVVGLVKLFKYLREHLGPVSALLLTIFAGAIVIKVLGMIGLVKKLSMAWLGVGTAAGRAALAQQAATTFGLPGSSFKGQKLGPGVGAGAARAMPAAGAPSIGKGGAVANAAKTWGSAIAAAAGPIGWSILGASMINDMSGGDFFDQARNKGWEGPDGDLTGAMQHLYKSTSTVPGNSTNSTTNININVAPTNVEVNADAAKIEGVIGEAVTLHIQEAARIAARNLQGNR